MGARMRIGWGAGYSGDRLDAPHAAVRDLCAAGERAAIIFEIWGEEGYFRPQPARNCSCVVNFEAEIAHSVRDLGAPERQLDPRWLRICQQFDLPP